jgi:uncharacterized protein
VQDEIFEWDDAKAAANLRDHGVASSLAIKVFRDHFAIERVDEREDYGEERINLIGKSDATLLHITFTERDGRIHLISARRAEKHEQDDYYCENSS